MAAGLVADGKEPGSVRPAHLPLVSSISQRDLRRRIERLEVLPLRAETARWVLEQARREVEPPPARGTSGKPDFFRADPDVDPGWLVATGQGLSCRLSTLELVASRAWWPVASRAVSDALGRLWRHGMAVALASLRLARDQQVQNPERIGKAGLVHQLGAWCVAAAEPEWLPRWLAVEGLSARREFERRTLGTELTIVARDVAERWGLDDLVADAAWLHDLGQVALRGNVAEPDWIRILQAAYQLAEQTPWALHPQGPKDRLTTDPRVKILMAEVQSRCRGAFLDPEATPREERITRENASLRVSLSRQTTAQESRDRLIQALIESDPTESRETWADRAARAWCAEPGVTAARFEWNSATPSLGEAITSVPVAPPAPTHTIPLEAGTRKVATLSLWVDPNHRGPAPPLFESLPAWANWAGAVASRVRLQARFEEVASTLRERLEGDEARLRSAKLDSLAEFAAGAGHELNNPLAVIVGRAQLLLARTSDPAAMRSLRAILSQAQRAHRILRDLIYVARPPAPRTRPCVPDEIWRASIRDSRPEAEERGILLAWDGPDQNRRVWMDPDGLRHLADTLIRNAIEATPRGGAVRVSTSGNAIALRWSVQDTGQGLSPADATHLFDLFYCGRQAGRGLGLGLPRVARFVELAGGEIHWQSSPGQGTTFVVKLPPSEVPQPPPPLSGPENQPIRRATA